MLNCQKTIEHGVLHGSLGIAIFFYHYARFLGNKRYAAFADGILEDAISSLNKETRSFSNGYLGVGWCMRYLAKHHFIQLQKDSLEAIDDMLMECWTEENINTELDDANSVFAEGLLALRMDESTMRHVLCDLCKVLKKEYLFKLSYINSVLYFINKLPKTLASSEEAKVCKQRVRDIIKDLCNRKNDLHPKDTYIFNELCKKIRHKPIKADKPLDAFEDVFMNWQTIVYSVHSKDTLSVEQVDEYLSKITCDVPLGKISLDGMATLGLHLITKSNIFNQ